MPKKIIFEKIRVSETNLEQWKRMADFSESSSLKNQASINSKV